MWPFSSQPPTAEKIKDWAERGKTKRLVKAIESDADPDIRIAVIRALAGLRLDDRVRNLLCEQFKNSDPNVREATLEAWAGNPDPKTAERLFAAIEEASESARKAAYGNLTKYFRKTRKELVELSQKTTREPPNVSMGRATSVVQEMYAAAGGDENASHDLMMRSIRGDEAAAWAYWQSQSLRRTMTIEAIGPALIAFVERTGGHGILLKMLDDIFLGEPGDYQERFQKLQRIVNTLREGSGELREQAPKAVIAILSGHSLGAAT